ncbi:MAG: hypothetical protein F9K29_24470 [Hyphomicrobiaceae bacterium]|nr:MAG: hypothetical protein F9K29_24470 [Hyphomicrobiaceae bacterium]
MRALPLAIALAIIAGPAAASPLKSLYTTIDLKACKQVKRHQDGGAWRCEGLPGYPVYVAEGDLRHFVSVGADAEKRRAAKQTLGPFNSIFEHGSNRATIEWRFVRQAERQIPYATIMRFHTSGGGRRGDVLVVSKVTERETCHVAYIDSLANHDAIALARKIADSKARTFDCRNEPRAEGETGRSPM